MSKDMSVDIKMDTFGNVRIHVYKVSRHSDDPDSSGFRYYHVESGTPKGARRLKRAFQLLTACARNFWKKS